MRCYSIYSVYSFKGRENNMNLILVVLIFLVTLLDFIHITDAGYCPQTYTCYRQTCKSSWGRRRCRTVTMRCTRNVCCEGFTGTSCNIVLHCTSGPCLNDGACTDIHDDYTCTCKPGTRGDNCEEVACATPPSIDNGYVTVTGTYYEGSTATYHCNQNYELIGGSGVLTCSSTATWDGQIPSCSLIDCGTPGSITNGHVTYTSTHIGSVARYTCDVHYNLTGGSQVRTCQSDRSWSGNLPACIFVNHCASEPCSNGAVCTDLLGDYTCTCTMGWSGRHCETDIQAPFVSGCSPNIAVNATELTKYVEWDEPSFYDPFGNELFLTKNYETPSYEFPWGDYTVQYTATKISNGIRTECSFTISVRPTPCEELNTPLNGARLCNGWKQDYGRFCIVACNHGYMIDPDMNFEMMYVCGASGDWSPSGQLPNCSVSVSNNDEALYYHSKYSDYSYTDTCQSIASSQSLGQLYIERLNGTYGEFSDFCNDFSDQCHPSNVELTCNANIP